MNINRSRTINGARVPWRVELSTLLLAFLSLALVLAACGGSDAPATSPLQLIAMVPDAAPVEQPQGRSAPAAPDAARKEAPAGIDGNGDRVRDDLESIELQGAICQ